MRTSAFGLLLTLALGGCATLVHGPVQDVRIESQPPGATATIYPQQSLRGPAYLKEEQIKVTTPSTVRLQRDTNYRIEFQKTGYAIAEKKVVSRPDWLLGLLGTSPCSACDAIGAIPAPWWVFPVSAPRRAGEAVRIANPEAILGNAFKLKGADDRPIDNWTGWGTPTVSINLAPVQ